jgi:hypothetical protein
MQLFVRNRRPTASLSTPLYLSVSATREPSLGEYLSDIEKSPLETARPELPIRARSAKISTLRDRLSSANIRKYREHFRYMEVRYGDGTGWLGREDSNRQMQILNPLRRLFSAMQILCRVIHFAWHIFGCATHRDDWGFFGASEGIWIPDAQIAAAISIPTAANVCR